MAKHTQKGSTLVILGKRYLMNLFSCRQLNKNHGRRPPLFNSGLSSFSLHTFMVINGTQKNSYVESFLYFSFSRTLNYYFNFCKSLAIQPGHKRKRFWLTRNSSLKRRKCYSNGEQWISFNELCASRLMEQSSLFQIGVSSLLLLQMAFWTLVSRLWRFRFLSLFSLSASPTRSFSSPVLFFHATGFSFERQQVNALSQLVGGCQRHGRPPPPQTLHTHHCRACTTLYARKSFRRCAVIKQFYTTPIVRPTSPIPTISICDPHTHKPVKILNLMKNAITLNSIRKKKNLALIRCRCGHGRYRPWFLPHHRSNSLKFLDHSEWISIIEKVDNTLSRTPDHVLC